MLDSDSHRSLIVQGAYTIVCAALIISSFFIPRQSTMFPGLAVTDPSKEVIELISEAVKLTSTINSAALAFAAGLAIKGREWSTGWRFLDSVAVIGCFIAGAVSYFGVYLCYTRLMSMTANGFINIFELEIIWSIRLQFWGIIAEVYLIGFVFCQMVVNRQHA